MSEDYETSLIIDDEFNAYFKLDKFPKPTKSPHIFSLTLIFDDFNEQNLTQQLSVIVIPDILTSLANLTFI